MASSDSEYQLPRLERGALIALALGATILTLLAGHPYEWWNAALLLAGFAVVTALCLTSRYLVLGAGLLVAAVVGSQVDSEMESSLLLVSVLALFITNSSHLTWSRIGALLACFSAPFLVRLFTEEVATTIWTFGILFPALMGWADYRQKQLSHQLTRARMELTERAVIEERRQIARDVHDVVGHGLAAAMVQIASARHVLRRDPEAADEALALAEQVGRASMQELRMTVAALRDDHAPVTSLPGGADLSYLIETARSIGQELTVVITGDPASVNGVRGLTLYRVCQEALVNASKHAPGAAVTLDLSVTGYLVRLVVENGANGRPPSDPPPTPPSPAATSQGSSPDTSRPSFGLRGMQERARAVGGELTAGPTPTGWLVELTMPKEVLP